MSIAVEILLLVLGFVLLIKGADFFVDGASSIAANFKVPKILIGLTIVAFGTSAPELAVSIKALASGSGDMVLGNVIGSNIINILLILGVAAIIRPLHIKKQTIYKEIPICCLITALLAVLLSDTLLFSAPENLITRSDGIVILLFFCVFLYYLVASAMRSREKSVQETPRWPLLKSFVFSGIGLAGIIFGSNFVVDSAASLAAAIGISERIISLSVIALGTSLPELVTTVVSARKKETDLALGNILGSNIFNICIVLGLPVTIFGSVAAGAFSVIDLVAFVAAPLLIFIFSVSKRKVTRAEGAFMLVAFLAYYSIIFLKA